MSIGEFKLGMVCLFAKILVLERSIVKILFICNNWKQKTSEKY